MRWHSVVLPMLAGIVLIHRDGGAQGAGVAREGYLTTSESARLFYRVVGRGRDTLIAIHGGPGGDLESIAGDFAPLAERHVVIFYDQRGAGRSELPTDTTRLAVARLADAYKRLADPNEDPHRACRDMLAVGLPPRLAEPDRTLRLIRSDLCASEPAGIRYGLTATNRVVLGYFGDYDLRDRLRRLDVPTLVVHGEEESMPMDLVEEWVTSLPRARLVRVPKAGHFAYAERPELVWPEVERFLGESAP